MTTKNRTSNWRSFQTQARAHAAQLEKQAATTQLVAMADGPLDALATVWDLAAFNRHATKARAARRHGRAAPHAPAPVSRLLSGFSEQLRDKCVAVAMLMQRDELERLGRITSGFVSALEMNDADVMLLIGDLLPRSPDVIASWLRTHLESLEARFAS